MLDNNSYNLMAQLVEESQSLWRIRNSYMQDASMCEECRAFWQRLAQDKENIVRELEDLVHEHMMAAEPEMAGQGTGGRQGTASRPETGRREMAGTRRY